MDVRESLNLEKLPVSPAAQGLVQIVREFLRSLLRFRILCMGAAEMVQQLGAPAALAEDLRSILSTLMVAHNPLQLQL